MLYKPIVTRRRADGTKYRTRSRIWWGRFRHPKTGKPVYVNCKTTQKTAAKMVLNQAELEAVGEAAGKVDPFKRHTTRALTEHIEDWRRALAGAGNTERYVREKTGKATRVCKGCGFAFWTDVAAADVWRFLGALECKKRTRNHHLDAIKAFTRWLVAERRAPFDPLAGAKPLTVDDEGEAGVFEPDELATLFTTTEAGPDRWGMSGLERRVFYQLAADTGFRSKECRTLTWGDLDLDGKPPCATVTAKRAKNRKLYEQPLTPGLVALLRRWQDAADNTEPADLVLPAAPDATNVARLLRRDLKAAGVPDRDGSERLRNFHSLRHTFATNLARGGVSPRAAMELMRHSNINLTLRRYSHVLLPDRAAAIAALPDYASTDAKTATGAA